MTKQNPYGRFAVYSYDKYQSQFPSAVPAARYGDLDDAKAHADSVTYKMVVVDMQSESSGFVYMNEQAPKSSPWGTVQHSHRFAEGIWFVSTASHGGYWLSEQRQKEFHEVEAFKDFGPQWLEEDCEACLVYLRWAGYATDEQIHDAIRTATVVSSWQRCTQWNRVVEWLTTTLLNERADAHADAVKHLWQRGSMATSGNGWTVWFHRGEEQREVNMDYPTKRYYTDDELIALAKPPAPAKKRSPFPSHCFVGNSQDFSPSDADPGL